jgi:hypothetical protein
MQFVRSDEGRFMRRLEAGPSGWLAPTTAPWPGASSSRWEEGVMRWLRTGAIRTPNGAAAQASVFLGVRQAPNGVTGGLTSTASWHRVLAFKFPVPQKRWAKIVTPPGWPWSKPQTPRAERRGFGGVAFTITTLRCREASEHAGPTGFGVPRALRRMSGLPDMRKRRGIGGRQTRARPRRHKNEGRFRMSAEWSDRVSAPALKC